MSSWVPVRNSILEFAYSRLKAKDMKELQPELQDKTQQLENNQPDSNKPIPIEEEVKQKIPTLEDESVTKPNPLSWFGENVSGIQIECSTPFANGGYSKAEVYKGRGPLNERVAIKVMSLGHLMEMVLKTCSYKEDCHGSKMVAKLQSIFREMRILSELEDLRHIVRYHIGWVGGPLRNELSSFLATPGNDPNNFLDMSLIARPVKGGFSSNSIPQVAQKYWDTIIYVPMELCELTLHSFCYEEDEATRPMQWEDLHEIFLQILTGLEYIHSVGIVHRDIKTENIFMKFYGSSYTIKIGDFGFARQFHGDEDDDEVTKVGTEYYSSPEMKSRRVKVDKRWLDRTDIYSLGRVMEELENKLQEGGDDDGVIKLENFPEKVLHCAIVRRELVERMLHEKANMRPSAKECLVEMLKLRDS